MHIQGKFVFSMITGYFRGLIINQLAPNLELGADSLKLNERGEPDLRTSSFSDDTSSSHKGGGGGRWTRLEVVGDPRGGAATGLYRISQPNSHASTKPHGRSPSRPPAGGSALLGAAAAAVPRRAAELLPALQPHR